MEDWSDILSPMQWSKAIKLPVIVYKEKPGILPISKDKPGIFPISGLFPVKVGEKPNINEGIRSSAKTRRVISPNVDLSVYLQRNKTDPCSKHEGVTAKVSTRVKQV